MTDNQDIHGPFIPSGTHVRYGGLEEGGPEYGVVVHCWLDEESHLYDCYVAFFGNEQPTGKPTEKPYILRYFSTSLKIVDTEKPIKSRP